MQEQKNNLWVPGDKNLNRHRVRSLTLPDAVGRFIQNPALQEPIPEAIHICFVEGAETLDWLITLKIMEISFEYLLSPYLEVIQLEH